MTARKLIALRLSEDGVVAVQRLADAEANGNLSEMIRTLLAEAVAARQAKLDV